MTQATLQTPNPTEPPTLWYFCVNEAGFQANLSNIKVALISAQANTSLRPICLYAGENPHFRNMLERLGATVITHEPSLSAELQRAYGTEYQKFKGHWLRVDLPEIETVADYVLYTDLDVMFRAPLRLSRLPRVLAATPEAQIADLSYFNSGVMVLNLKRLRRLQSAFKTSIKKRLAHNFAYPPHDQGSFNSFFQRSPANFVKRKRFEWMSPDNNWKPYWGINPDATVVHFHGPNPPDIRRFEAGLQSPGQEALVALWNRDVAAYSAYCDEWDRYESAGQARLDSFL